LRFPRYFFDFPADFFVRPDLTIFGGIRRAPRSRRHAMPFVESCLFCGVALGPGDEKRRKLPGVLAGLLRELWVETPLAWAVASGVVAATAADFSLALCMPCVHHLNRRRRWRRAGAGRALLLMDALLVFLAHPFEAPVPDSRLLRRLAAALRTTATVRGVAYGNMYARLVPPAARALLLEGPVSHGAFVAGARAAEWARRGAGSVVGTRAEMRALRQLATAAEVDALAAAVLAGAGGDAVFTGDALFTGRAGGAAPEMERRTVARAAVASPADVDGFEQAVRAALRIEHGAVGPFHGAAYVLLRHRVLRRLAAPTGVAWRAGGEPFQVYAAPNLLVACEAGPGGEIALRADVLYPELAPGGDAPSGKRRRAAEAEEELQFELEAPTCEMAEDVTVSP
jgi:hypothetical protein